MIRAMVGIFIFLLNSSASLAVECESGERDFETGNYVWLGDSLVPLPTSHFIHSFGRRDLGKFGEIVEIHLKALRPDSDVRSITLRSDADIQNYDSFNWEQLREIGKRGKTRKVVAGSTEFVLVEYPGVPSGTKAIFESEEYQIVISGEAACQMLVNILNRKRSDGYLTGR